MRRVPPASLREAGAAFVFVVLVMLALLALAHGALVGALSELAGSRAAVRELRARAGAERGLQATLAAEGGPWLDSLGLWEERTTSLGSVGGVEASGTMRKLGPEAWLAEGVGRLPGGIVARTATLAWALDPLTRVASLSGVVSVGGGAPVAVSGTIDASALTDVVAPMRPEDCDPWLAALVSHYAVGVPPPVAAALDSAWVPALGLLDFEALLGLPPVTVAGSGTPAPEEALGACAVDAAWNWGDPTQPWGPCGSHLALRRGRGDLRVEGGVGQGVLIVEGALTLTAGARLTGLLISGGEIRLEGGSRFQGMALAAGGILVDAGSEVRGSACWAVRALAAHRGRLSSPVPVPDVGRIGPF